MVERGVMIGSGRTSDVYAYGQTDAVKVPRPGVPSHWAQIEAELTAAVHELGLPTPAVRGITDIDGRPSVVFERIVGESMWARMLANPAKAASLAKDLAAIHHDVQHERAPDRLPDLRRRMCAKIDQAEQLNPADRLAARELIAELPSGDVLCHGDLHPGNILMSATGPVIIDWFDASSGHASADIVRTSLLLRPARYGTTSPDHLPGAEPGMVQTLHRSYLDAISASTDLDPEILRRWEPVVAASRLAEGAQADETELLALWADRITAPEAAPREPAQKQS